MPKLDRLRIWRGVGYSLLLLGMPAVGVAGWFGYTLWLPQAAPEWYILGLSVAIAVLLSAVLLRPEFDSSANSQAYSSLLRSQEKFVALYQRSPIPYIILDSAGVISMYNQAAVHIFESRKENLWGASLQQFFKNPEAADTQVVQNSLVQRKPLADAEIQITTMADNERWVLLSISFSEYGDERLVSLVDITHQKEVEAVKSEFVALATHQLRTPIAAIRWNLELLQKKLDLPPEEKVYTYITKIERNVSRMNALINDFLNVSKLEMGTFATEASPIELRSFFESVIEEFAKPVNAKSLTVHRQYEPEQVTTIIDERLLHIVISNLFSNAVKYVSAHDEITAGYVLFKGTLTITIADTGIGIPAAEHDKLFGKFYRASNALQHQAEGTGLGLYVVRQSVEQLGGRIAMESKIDVGTTFTITIPHHPPHDVAGDSVPGRD